MVHQKIKILFLSLVGIILLSSCSNKISTHSSVCPQNYIPILALTNYSNENFCVSKYEAKNDGTGTAVSVATGIPWVSINRDDAITACKNNGDGYDLISNDQWQSIARDAESVASNWASNFIGDSDGLSRGHSDSNPENLLPAGEDSDGCFANGDLCSDSVWNDQRRTTTLSNGAIIWDLAGNVWEWVKDDNSINYGTSAYIAVVTEATHTTTGSLSGGPSRSAKSQFGPAGDYSTLSSTPFGNLGLGSFNANDGAIRRGGGWGSSNGAGLFATQLGNTPTDSDIFTGFRCVFVPVQ